jgi:hypothetical protein
VNVGEEVAIEYVLNVLAEAADVPANTIIQFATGGVIVGAVTLAVLVLFNCPALAPIGVPVSCPVNAIIAPLLLAFPPVNVKLAAATSEDVACFQNIEPRLTVTVVALV